MTTTPYLVNLQKLIGRPSLGRDARGVGGQLTHVADHAYLDEAADQQEERQRRSRSGRR
ncbi:hypothetical protein [Nocardioides sp. YIM 152315]|uniref:hypothetical protein n=1 Tax=Nocardioides sp. YIM 152315 TaxID=3031760 RepID=UPI0023DC86F3|nr:hypothetical protein [Nocardioides sp. YIM 152315]MDF1602162.1 hypothetical protein [Nocardioides sp. YIM 152315]